MTNEEINKLIAELERLKTPEQEGIEIPECDWMIDIKGDVSRSYSQGYNLEYGYKRTTEEACKLASKRTIRTNRLSLLAHILGVEKEFVFGESNYYVFQQDTYKKLWKTNCSINIFYPGCVYMTKEGAESIAVILNNNEFSLELEDE